MDTDGLILATFIIVLGIVIFTIIAAVIRFFRTKGSIASKFSKMFAGILPAGSSVPSDTAADKDIVKEDAKKDPVELIKKIFIDNGTMNVELYNLYIKNDDARLKLAERLCEALYDMRDNNGYPMLYRNEPAEGYYAHAISSALANVGEAMVNPDVEITEQNRNNFRDYIVKAFPYMEIFIA